MGKVKGTENPADMNTKGLSGDEITKYVKMIGMGYKEGRSELAPEVHQVINKTKCVRFNSTSSKVTRRARNKSQQCKSTGVSGGSDVSHVFASHGECDYTCGCAGCWMYCDGNERAWFRNSALRIEHAPRLRSGKVLFCCRPLVVCLFVSTRISEINQAKIAMEHNNSNRVVSAAITLSVDGKGSDRSSEASAYWWF